MKKVKLFLIAGICILAINLFAVTYAEKCLKQGAAKSLTGGTPVIDRKSIQPGYILLSPLDVTNKTGGKVFLTDHYGKVLHTWNTQYPPLYARLTKNGNLIAVHITPDSSENVPGNGRSGMIAELDWNSAVLFKYENPAMHHDFEILPDGSVALLVWERLPAGIARDVKGGIAGTDDPDGMWGDKIVVVNKQGKETYSWHAYDHLDISLDPIASAADRKDWTHANSIQYVSSNPVNGKKAFIVSMRSTSKVYIIDYESGNVIWRSPQAVFGYQHDATVTKDDTLLVFDNEAQPAGTRVAELNPVSNKIVWEFSGGADNLSKLRFDSPVVGGAQRLPNGNTFITDGLHGHLFEVDKDGKLVWDFVSPLYGYKTGAWPVNSVFKARKYAPDEIQWPVSLPASLPADLCF